MPPACCSPSTLGSAAAPSTITPAGQTKHWFCSSEVFSVKAYYCMLNAACGRRVHTAGPGKPEAEDKPLQSKEACAHIGGRCR